MLRWLSRLRRPLVGLDVRDAYARWAASYPPEAHNPLMLLEQRALLELLPDVAGRTVLDLACGTGRYLAWLIEHRAACVVGLDLSPHMLARARTVSRDLAQADLLSLPLASSSCEVIVCGLAVGHVPDLRRALVEMGRVLTPNGILLYSDFHPFGSLAGWKRTFRAEDGREYAAQHFAHFYSDHHAACRAAGLTMEEVREPQIDFDHKWRGCPAAIVIRARKLSSHLEGKGRE